MWILSRSLFMMCSSLNLEDIPGCWKLCMVFWCYFPRYVFGFCWFLISLKICCDTRLMHLQLHFSSQFQFLMHLWFILGVIFMGLAVIFMQQSAAFKILRTRLKTVPAYALTSEQFKRPSSGNSYSQMLHNLPSGSQVNEDGDVNSDSGNSHSGINFTSRLQQFEQMQRQHRLHAKAQAHIRNSSTSVSKVIFSLISCMLL